MPRYTSVQRDYLAEIVHGLHDMAGYDDRDPGLTAAMVRRLNGHENLKQRLAQEGVPVDAVDDGVRSR